MSNAKIIGAFSGTGKSIVGARYKNVVDLDLGDYKFVYDESESIPHEVRKAMKKYEINPDWPNNYIEAIIRNKPLYDIVLVSYCPEIAHLLDYYFTPSKTGWEILKKRLINRGNNQRYIEITRMLFEQSVPPGRFIHKELGDNEFLEQALIKESLL